MTAPSGAVFLLPPSGVKTWQFRYRAAGKPQTATFGKFSDTQGLAWARGKEARSRVEAGDHLTQEKRLKKAKKHAASGNTFASVSAAWLKSEARRSKWTPDYRDEVEASLTNHLSALDALPLAEISAAMAAPHLRRVERTAPDMAKKVRQRLRSILDYAVEDGVIPLNPIPAPRRRKKAAGRTHFPAVLHDGWSWSDLARSR